MARTKTTLEILAAEFKRKRNNSQVLAAVVKAHPRTTMTLATVNWYRNRMRKTDKTIPSEHSLR
jgi:hypothetical protein